MLIFWVDIRIYILRVVFGYKEEIMKIKDLPKYTQLSHYQINVSWDDLLDHIERWENKKTAQLEINPDFQRGHVWSEAQQIAYVEYKLANGPGADIIYFNCKGWMTSFEGPFVCVDGLQRLTAVKLFLENKIQAYGCLCSEFEDGHKLRGISFLFNVNNLKTRKEVLTWYLEMNHRGTPHTEEDLNKVRKLVNKEILNES